MASDEFAGDDFLAKEKGSHLPGTWSSYAPIVIPIVLISAQSISRLFLDEDHILRAALAYIGWPVAALSVGVWLAFRNIRTDVHRKASRSDWIEEALRISAMILVVTGLGGSLSEILKGTPAVDFISTIFADYGLPELQDC
jgi:GntP family gluconate:H+ symporter